MMARILIGPFKPSSDTFPHKIIQVYVPHNLNISHFGESVTTSYTRSQNKTEVPNTENDSNNVLNKNMTFKTLKRHISSQYQSVLGSPLSQCLSFD